jgi:hypothetical protein
MARSRKLSPGQLDEMGALRERGWSPARIAQHFSALGTLISEGAISWQCMRIGADAPPRLRGKSHPSQAPYTRNGHQVRPYTPTDDAKLLEMEAAGATLAAMCKALGRKNNSILGRLMTLARQQARAEESGAS